MMRRRDLFKLGGGAEFGHHELLMFKDQHVVVPPQFRRDLIRTAHTVAHIGIGYTKRTLEKYFYWPNMAQDVDVALSTCVGCLHRQTTNLRKGEHHSKKLPPGKCNMVCVNVVGPVSVKSRKKYLLTIMDAFSRYADAVPMEGKSAREVSEALTTSLTGVFGGTPLTIIADRGMEFVGRVMRTAMSMLGHRIQFIPADLHQSNMVERFHRTLMSMIQAVRTEGVKHWVPAVRMALQYYNHKEHESTGHAPVEIHLGIDPRHPGLLAPHGQEAAPIDYAKLDDYNKDMAKIARWVRGKVVTKQAEQAREVARYYQNKNLKLLPGSLVWLNKRATNKVDGDMIIRVVEKKKLHKDMLR